MATLKYFSVSLLLLAACNSPQKGGAVREPLRVGVAAVDITPTVGTSDTKDARKVWLAGFGPGRAATGVHDKLWARAIYIEKGSKRVVLVAVDLIGVSHYRLKRWRDRLGVPSIIASTHVHSGPDTLGLWGPKPGASGLDNDYNNLVESKVIEAANKARDSATTATLEAGSAKVEGVVKDTRPPDVRDEYVRWILARDEKGEVIGTVVAFASHPEALGSKNTLITSDYPHFLREKIEKGLGGTCAFFSADIGGMQTPDIQTPTFGEAQRVGEKTASAVGAGTLLDVSEVKYATREFDFPLDNEIFIKAIQAKVFGDVAETVKVKNDRRFVASEITAIRLGDLTILSCPGEALPEVGQRLFAAMTTKHQMLIGLGQDEVGYIIPKDDFVWTKYEESMSLGPDTAPILIEQAQKLLQGF